VFRLRASTPFEPGDHGHREQPHTEPSSDYADLAGKLTDVGMSTAVDLAVDEFDHARHDRLIRTTVSYLNDLGVPAVVTDLSGVIQASNRAAVALYQCQADSLIGRPMISSVPVENHARCRSLTSTAIAVGHWQGHMSVITPTGGTLRTQVRATLLLDEGGQSAGVLVIFPDSAGQPADESDNLPQLRIGGRPARRDATDTRRQLEQKRLQTLLLDEVGVAVHATDMNREVLAWNAGAERLFGWTESEAVGRTISDLVVPPRSPVDDAMRQTISEGPWEGDVTLARKGGGTFPAYVRTRLIENPEDGTPAIVVVTVDVTERRRMLRELQLAQDHLRAVIDSVQEGMCSIDATGRITYLNPMAERLLGWRKEDLVGAVMHTVFHFRHADGSASAFEDSAIMRAGRDGETRRVTDDVFVRADGTNLPVSYTASPFATDAGNEGCIIVFSDITGRKAEEFRVQREMDKLGWLKRVREALDEQLFVLHAQPIINVSDETVVQRELLIRMLNPDGSRIVAPGAFLPVAEEFGLIIEIDRWVIDRAAELAASGMAVELNISAASIGDPRLIPHIEQAFDRTGAIATDVIFEITETALLREQAEGLRFVRWLHEFGCGVALDDFGTGYGGFTHLKQLPIDYLKIDVEFVRDVLTNPASRKVVETIVDLAKRFNLRTVAEGVEDAPTLALLRHMGVHRAQGYHIGRPALLDTASKPA
jgi:PAS domain S-box-containing protein